MKKLICEKDILTLAASGKNVCCVDADTIITPSARDAAGRKGIEFVSCTAQAAASDPESLSEITPDVLYGLINTLIEQGKLSPDFCEKVLGSDRPYRCEKDPSGLKVVRGDSVRMDEFFPGSPGVKFQELIDKNDSPISSGLLEIDHDSYKWVQNYDENDYVLEGSLMVCIDGRCYTANQGDCIYIPKGASVVMGSKNSRCKVFYNTYPSNWADLR